MDCALTPETKACFIPNSYGIVVVVVVVVVVNRHHRADSRYPAAATASPAAIC